MSRLTSLVNHVNNPECKKLVLYRAVEHLDKPNQIILYAAAMYFSYNEGVLSECLGSAP